MKKDELKQLIKPLVKECIHEALLEEGLLSNVVAEVAKGLQASLIVEAPRTTQSKQPTEDHHMKRKMEHSRRQMTEKHQKLLDAVGRDSYNGVNLFEGTAPLSKGGDPSAGQSPPSVLGENSNDPGVDISDLVGDASRLWKAMK
jgi:hypothetical protein